MFQNVNIALLIAVIFSIVYLHNGIHHYLSDRKNLSKKLYLYILISLSAWSMSIAMMNTTKDATIATLWRNIAVIFWGIMYPLIAHLYIYTGLKNSIAYKKYHLHQIFYIPTIIFYYFAYFVKPYNPKDLILSKIGWCYVNTPPYNIDFYLLIYVSIYIIALTVFSIFFYKHAKFKRQRKAIISFVCCCFVALTIGTITDIIIPLMPDINFIPLAYASNFITCTVVAITTRRYMTISLSSNLILNKIVRTVDEGIIACDYNNIIGYINPKAREHFRIPSFIKLTNLAFPEDLIAIMPDEYDLKVEKISENKERITFRINNEEEHYYEVKVNTMFDSFNEPVALVHIIQDITELINIQKDLALSKSTLEYLVKERTQELDQKHVALSQEVELRLTAEKQISWLADNDKLTRLNNINKMTSDVNLAFKKSNSKQIHALIYIDIHNFKFVNENLGRNVGDIYLQYVAETLIELTPANAKVYRVGGDEFAIFIQDLSNKIVIDTLLIRIFEVLSKQRHVNNLKLSLGFSCGIAYFPEHAKNATSLLYKAEVAMLESKKLGVNHYVFYEKNYERQIFKREKLIEDIKTGIKNEEFILYYQPLIKKINKEYKIVGLEALIRWRLADGSILNPGEFIEVAENSNQIIKMGKIVIKQALQDISELKHHYGKNISIAINLSVNQLLDNNLIPTIKTEIENSKLNPEMIEIELTERMLVNTITQYDKKIAELKKLGIKISIDDFGVEYSSLNYLKILPIDKIKIDMSFIHGIGKNKHDEIIIDSLIQLTEKLDLSVLAEGIETKEQLHFLEKISNETIYQGYYFYKPMPFEELVKEDILEKIQ